MNKQELEEWFQIGVKFHGHRCPAMPWGLRAGLAALEKLGVHRSQNKELFCLAETGPDHAMACFLDGVQVATGCTYGKANVLKLNYGKLAFTLIDMNSKRAVRVVVNPDTQQESLSPDSEFFRLRSSGVQPQDVAPELVNPLVEKVMTRPEEELFSVSEVFEMDYTPPKGTFEWYRCEECDEGVFANGVRVKDGKKVCVPCSEY
ncbi:MAG: formylmethanofuran dehydrogenase [Armatimonadetes bacterium]|nr:formylmethanofuran dehydrogenase [Armatimonadota bacterium]